jgi:hypothetical protein
MPGRSSLPRIWRSINLALEQLAQAQVTLDQCVGRTVVSQWRLGFGLQIFVGGFRQHLAQFHACR